jgi:DNA-binding beta-propeller fold protein YncE
MKNALLFGLSLVLSCSASAESSAPLKLTQTIPLPGVRGRFDHLAFDAQRQRLYIAAAANNSVEVVDVAAGKALRPFAVKDPHGLLVFPKPNLLYVTSGTDGCVKVFDCGAERAIKTIGPLPDADNIRFDTPANRIYVAHGNGALAMINAQTGVQTVTIPLAGHPEAFAIEAKGSRIFANVPATRHVAVIDRLSREVIARWSPGTNAANYAMALDESNQRLFVSCRQPPRLVVLDARSGDVVSELETAADVDDVFFDAKRRRIYASCGAGSLEIVAQTDADHYAPVSRLPTAEGARTCVFVPEADLLFLAVPARESGPAEIRVLAMAN